MRLSLRIDPGRLVASVRHKAVLILARHRLGDASATIRNLPETSLLTASPDALNVLADFEASALSSNGTTTPATTYRLDGSGFTNS
ncbi:hypothetical protein [Aurantimonas sp. VKM B-3413]|uniref:hypothetical protein n=1 Tax=Aurantimonas sp. VKM B-3413 TaxID=2779401 RepID=UPI001E38291F|nr:hypothetical protein [Aurantimonas sp. VKM B-3413]MCB8836099.1 hypothetical protein [Aurantimonas sp. VKM B-3413]